ncbi:hypothetical protein ANAPC5_01223 [Anaplasma phagocytophilum]|nr:hypothetical protein ANAPC5_01223 [Anaplasma phagocytophilum]
MCERRDNVAWDWAERFVGFAVVYFKVIRSIQRLAVCKQALFPTVAVWVLGLRRNPFFLEQSLCGCAVRNICWCIQAVFEFFLASQATDEHC